MSAIAPLEPPDIGAAVNLWREAGLTRPWNDPHADAAMALASPASTILAMRENGALIATAMLGFDGHRAWVYYLAVALSHRGGGRGAAMMRAGEDWARSRGAPKIQLMVRADNALASGFYEARGYAREPVTVFSKRLDGRGRHPL